MVESILESGLREHVEHYALVHRNPVNKALHFIGIPILTISLLGLTTKIAFGPDDLAALRPNR